MCHIAILLAVAFVPALVFCMCFAIAFAFSSPLLLLRVYSRICRLARGGVSFSLIYLVRLRRCHVCAHVAVLLGLSLAYARCFLS